MRRTSVEVVYKRDLDRGGGYRRRLAARTTRDMNSWGSLGFHHQYTLYSDGPSTLTLREVLTLLISRPSSASSLLRSSASWACSSGLSSGDSVASPLNSGFLSAILNASAMMAASAPENRPDSWAELEREIANEPSSPVVFPWTIGVPPVVGLGASAIAEAPGPSRGEDS